MSRIAAIIIVVAVARKTFDRLPVERDPAGHVVGEPITVGADIVGVANEQRGPGWRRWRGPLPEATARNRPESFDPIGRSLLGVTAKR